MRSQISLAQALKEGGRNSLEAFELVHVCRFCVQDVQKSAKQVAPNLTQPRIILKPACWCVAVGRMGVPGLLPV